MEKLLITITEFLLVQSWQVSILFVVILLICLFMRNASAHWRYLLWCLVTLKCCIPPLMTFSLAILPENVDLSLPSSAEQRQTDHITSTNNKSTTPLSPIEIQETKPSDKKSKSTPITAETTPKPSIDISEKKVNEKSLFQNMTWQERTAYIWCFGFFISLFSLCLRSWRMHRFLLKNRQAISDQINKELINLQVLTDIKTLPNVWMIPGFGQPFVWGLGAGEIYLPSGFEKTGTTEHRQHVIVHELAHVQRRDAAINTWQLLVQAVFFFHPLIWIVNKCIRQEREKCCDEMAIALLESQPTQYSKAIVDTLTVEYKTEKNLPSIAVAGPVKNIEDRIKTIMHPGKKFYHRPTEITLLTICLLAFIVTPTTLALKSKATQVDQPDLHKPYLKKLSNGISVELLGVCHHPSQKNSWWQPNSEPLKITPYDQITSQLYPDKDQHALEFAFRVGQGNHMIDYALRGDDAIQLTMPSRALSNRYYLNFTLYASAIFPDSLATTDFRFGISSDDWQFLTNIPAQTAGELTLDDETVTYQTATTNSVSQVVLSTIDTMMDQEGRVIALNNEGLEIHPLKTMKHYSNNKREMTTYFAHVALEEIQSFVFQVQDYEWLEFKNIALKPKHEKNNSSPSDDTEFTARRNDSSNTNTIAVPADYDSISDAILYAEAYDTILVSSGIYRDPLYIDKPIIIKAEDPTQTILHTKSTTEPAVWIDATAYCHIEGLTIDGSTDIKYDPNTVDAYPLVLIQNSQAHLFHCDIKNGLNNGITIEDHGRGTIQQCRVHHNLWNGISITDEGSKFTFRTNQVHHNKYNGIETRKHATLIAEDNICNNNNYGITIYHSTNAVILKDNYCTKNLNDGIYLGITKKALLEYNQCHANGVQGISVHNNQSIIPTIRFNHCYQNNYNGIYLINYGKALVESNVCKENLWHGISADGDHCQAVLVDNKCIGNQKDGIYLSNWPHVKLMVNKVEKNGSINFGRLKRIFQQKRFEELEAMATWLRKDKTMHSGGGRPYLNRYYEYLGDYWAGYENSKEPWLMKTLAQWKKEFPESITPLVIEAKAYNIFGWEERGEGYADDVSQGSWKKFETYQEKAWQALEKALLLEVHDPELYNMLIKIGTETSTPEDDIQDYFHRGWELHRTYYPLYTQRARGLLPRWGGEPGQLVSFAEYATNLLGDQNGAYARIATYALSYHYATNGDDFIAYGFDYERMKRGFDDILENYPNTQYYDQAFCIVACLHKDKPTARRIFKRLSKRNLGDLHASLWGTQQKHDQLKEWAHKKE